MFETCMHKSCWLSPFCENWTFLRFSYSQAVMDIVEDPKLFTFPKGYLKSGCNKHLSLLLGVPLLWPHEHSLLSSLQQITRCGMYNMGFLSSWQILNEAKGNSYKQKIDYDGTLFGAASDMMNNLFWQHPGWVSYGFPEFNRTPASRIRNTKK